MVLLASGKVKSQNFEPILPLKASVSSNLVNEASLSINFEIQLKPGQQLNDEYWFLHKESIPEFHFTYSGQTIFDKNCPVQINMYSTAKGFGIKITSLNAYFINHFLAKDNQIGVSVDADIKFKYSGIEYLKLMNADKNKKIEPDSLEEYHVIIKDVINQLISESLSISDSARETYLNQLNNFYYYDNKVDFGVDLKKDSSTNYFLNFKLENTYNSKSVFKCRSNQNSKSVPVFWKLEGRLSTNFDDTLNFINYYPLNIKFEDYLNKIPYEFNLKFGHEANQIFTNRRVVLDANFNCMIPNLINLTTATSNRIRLKPTLNAGIKGYYDYSKGITNFISGQAYLKLHYYIPIFNNYAVIIEENPFYDFSKERNPDHKIANNYSITFGAELPKTGFKAMFKYVNGKSDINFKQGSIIGVGLLMDFFQEKK